ncbi:MAG: hypothetical protein HY581_10775 [Nitrospirae bacterium]|nr:hypothetical protein [Nitrospirota bacterium]
METSEALDVIGNLVSALKAYTAKLPAVMPLSVMPGGFKPAPETVMVYEQAVYRFRSQAGSSAFRRLNDLLIESLEAFESGWVLKSAQPLLLSLDLIELMQREKAITMTAAEAGRLREYRSALHRLLPGNQPELEGAGKGL